jgi:hypothetical protein
MLIRILAVPDWLLLHEFDAVFRAVLSWDHIGFLFRVHGQVFNSFRRATRSRTLREFQLRPTETFLYTGGAIISGSGKSGSWTSNPGLWATMHHYAWAVAALHRHNTAVVPPATG